MISSFDFHMDHEIADLQKGLQVVGDITEEHSRVSWKIPKFFSLPLNNESFILYSSEFFIANRSWRLYANLEKHLIIGVRAVSGRISNYKVRLGITGKGSEFSSFGVLSCGGMGTFVLINRTEIDDKKDQWVPRGNLNLFFAIEDSRIVSIKEISLQELKGMVHVKKLQHDLEFLFEGNMSDVVVRVSDKEFKCHRCILGARSPVFLAMLTHDTKENSTGVINIEDSDPDLFAHFLVYVYTGSMEIMTSENVFDLYVISDKYEVIELKTGCVEYMLQNISIDSFCDVIDLSLRHNEKSLTEACIDLFKENWNSLDIIKTTKWQVLLNEDPVACNELFIKLLESKK